MSIKVGKREITRMAKVLDQDYDSVLEAASAALTEAIAIYESRAQYVVVGQIYYSDGWIDPEDARASKVSLGMYSTPGEAQKAAESLVVGTSTHEEARAWVLPVHHGTPSSWYMARKKAREEASRKPAPTRKAG